MNQDEIEKMEFEKAFELRKFEIENFWKRGWFFGALLIALSAGYFSLKPETQSGYYIYVSFIVFLVCFAQCLMNRGSKYWQERWEYFTKQKEEKLNLEITTHKPNSVKGFHIELGKKSENELTKAWRISVSKMTFLVWDLITLFWLFVWLSDTKIGYALIDHVHYQCRIRAILFHLALIVYVFLFIFKTKGKWSFTFKNGGGGKVFEMPF
ncbi:MAG: hypothetical protein JWQ09_5194 [Segetibacter sp.]|nr:hypothetical protein [Segetibacter sp.]